MFLPQSLQVSEHQTTFFPVHPNIRYPKRYNVNNIKGEEWCEKDFPRAHDFADGIFSIGCPCAVNVTYGFELNLQHESGRNFFKFLTCRKINFRKLKGIIYDFSCGLQRYCMNREPLDFENIQFLVDGVHFAGQKKLKKVDKRSNKKGHLGCSASYNFNEYKTYINKNQEIRLFSQGREQMHSVLEPLAKQLRQKSYHNFMKSLIAFFAIRNLKNMKKL